MGEGKALKAMKFQKDASRVIIGLIRALLGLARPHEIEPMYKINPRSNMWLTFANQTNQTSFCISMQSVTDPFRTCLIGTPYWDPNDWKGWVSNETILRETVVNASCSRLETYHGSRQQKLPCGGYAAALVINALNVSLPWDPQEIDLLGSMFGNESCFHFAGSAFTGTSHYRRFDWIGWTNVTSRQVQLGKKNEPKPAYNYKNKDDYCNGSAGTGIKNPKISVWVNNSAKAIPPGYFLICGDRAWQGIPKRAIGGPCYFGKLIMFAPPMSILKNRTRAKRALRQLTPQCDGRLSLYDRAGRVALSLLLPWGAASKALTDIGRLACLVAKEINATSKMISELTQDMDSVRHAVLQNRAAIDVLLLAHGHGCEDLDGMCCMNLSDHSKSIHKQLHKLQQNLNAITVESGLSHWLSHLSIRGWLADLVKQGTATLVTILIVLCIFGCLISCAIKVVKKTFNGIWVAQKQKGRFVGFLEKQGHIVSNPDTLNMDSIGL
ncbi:uncharacterized protein LOC142365547 isoform X1 [Opisthocomus hoazin]|uniref:uncharacterized protein LOC142365547 isoform X1 n=1 Tax=Opisthocomus hoazin TaxID=30419 RepID=UPI003F5351B9